MIKNCLRYSLPFVALFAFASVASAQTTGAAAKLTMTATVQDSMQLIISTHVSPGATVDVVTTGTDNNAFTLDFGNVNGLGLGTPTTGVSITTSGLTGTLYTTPINITPIFSGFVDGSAADITVKAGGSDDDGLAGEGSSAVNTAPVGTTAGSAILTGKTSESLNARFVSFFIARTQATGVLTASFIYEMTVDAP